MTPAPVPVAAALLTSSNAKAAAERGMVEVSKRADQVRRILLGDFVIESQEVTIRCPEQVEVVSVAFKAKPGILGKKVRVGGGKPKRAHLRPLIGLSEAPPDSVSLYDQGFEIRTDYLTGDGLFLLDVEYALSSPGFLDALVDRNVPREAPKGNCSEYWLEAQLKHPKALKVDYGRFDLRDLDFEVDVGIAEHLKTVIPGSLIRELEASVALLQETDIHKKAALARTHTVAMRQRGSGSTTELLGSLQSLFLPDAFREFVEVRQDFRYGDCKRGLSLYDTLPIPTWPRTMRVVSRTDLSLDLPAAHGILEYKKDDFLSRVEGVLGTRTKAAKRGP